MNFSNESFSWSGFQFFAKLNNVQKSSLISPYTYTSSNLSKILFYTVYKRFTPRRVHPKRANDISHLTDPFPRTKYEFIW